MANLYERIVEGIIGGFIGGVVGFATDIMIGAMLETFKSYNFAIAVLAVVYPIASFLSGLKEAYVAGFFFSLGIILAGVVLNDFVTILLGFLSMAGLAIGSVA
jgi:hypothetical protein